MPSEAILLDGMHGEGRALRRRPIDAIKGADKKTGKIEPIQAVLINHINAAIIIVIYNTTCNLVK